jgi:hypothetical protein
MDAVDVDLTIGQRDAFDQVGDGAVERALQEGERVDEAEVGELEREEGLTLLWEDLEIFS